MIDLRLTGQYYDGQVHVRLNGEDLAVLPAISEPHAGPGAADEVVLETVAEVVRQMLYTCGYRQWPDVRRV